MGALMGALAIRWGRTRGALGIVALVTAGMSSPSTASAQAVALPNGSEAPSIVLELVDGGTLDLGEVMGRKPVLLEFWATWCEKCDALHPRMVEAFERFGDRVEFVGVAVAVGQSKRGVRRHLAKKPLPFPMTWDAKGEAVRAYDVMLTSTIVIVDADGRIAYSGTGTEQDPVGVLAEVVRRNQ